MMLLRGFGMGFEDWLCLNRKKGQWKWWRGSKELDIALHCIAF